MSLLEEQRGNLSDNPALDLLARPELAERVVSAQVSVWRRLPDIWVYRQLLLSLVRKELKVKYKNSVLGFVWSMLNPALTLFVYWFVFQIVLRNGIPLFAIYLLCGLVVWNLFQASLPAATTSVVGNAGIVKKVAFPREVLALAPVGAALFFFGLQVIVLALALGVFQVIPTWYYLPLLIPAVVALLIFTSALAVFLSAVNVYMRDTQHLLEIVLMAWFWATPVVYDYELIASKLPAHHIPSWLPMVNPVTPVVLVFQRALYAHANVLTGGSVLHLLPDMGVFGYLWPLLGVIAFSVLLYIGALVVFIRLEGNFAEEL